MATSFGALCGDFFINQKLALKMDLPSDRETVLHMFDLVRKAIPRLERFHRYENEFILESSRREPAYQWLGLRQHSIRTGHVNPDSMEDAYALHRLILETAPYHLTISPLDIDYVELQFGFDLECHGNHDEVVAAALFGQSPMGELVSRAQGKLIDVQPVFGQSLTDKGDLQAFIDVKTRQRGRRGSSKRFKHEPINVALSLRQFGPVHDVAELTPILENMAKKAESLATDQVVPFVLTPIIQQISPRSA